MGSGGVAIAALPTVICFKVTFSDGLGGHRQMNWTDNPIISWGRLYILYLLSHTQIIMISNRTQAGNQLLLFRKDLGLIGDFVVCYFCEGSNETDAFFCTFFPHDIWPYASLYFTDVSLVK